MSFNELKKIGKYEVEKVLGRGGMGVVFKAVDPALGRPVAIKMMTAGYSDDPDLLKRFYREAQFTGNLHHPNIVTVYDLGDLQGNPYFVMEFLEGESLDAMIVSNRDVSILQKITYITQVCAGLDYAHQQRIIHRDIKPANVMVLKDGSVKIVDFGIARLGNDRLTRPRQVMGSYHYMSPEQINDKEIDARTDIFSTGVVLFQLLTYKLPFEAADIVSTLMKVINEPTPPLSKYISGYPPELDEIVGRALQKNKEDRYQSTEEFSLDLLQVAEKLKEDAIRDILAVAENLLEKGDLTGARQEILQALKLDRQNQPANEMMRRTHQLVQKRQRVEQAKGFLVQAEDALANRDYDFALRSLYQAITLDPTDPDLPKLNEAVRELKNRGDQFREAMREAASLQSAGDLRGAQGAVQRALALEPEHPQALDLERAILRQIEEEARRQQVERLLEQARLHIFTGEYTQALNVLETAGPLAPGSEAVKKLADQANFGREQERRREELNRLISEIENALGREDYEFACAASVRALGQFPAEPDLLQLQQLAEQQRAAITRRKRIDEIVATAYRLIEDRRADEALRLLQDASREFPGEPAIESCQEAAQTALEKAAAEKRKTEYLHNAQDAISRKDYREAMQILQAAKAEFGGADFDDLLQFAEEQHQNYLREQKIQSIADQARHHIAAEEYTQAIQLIDSARQDVQDERLNLLVSEARRGIAEFDRGVEEAINNSQRLLAEERADEAVALLTSQRHSFSRVPEFRSALEEAQRRQAYLQEISDANQQVFTVLANGDVEQASALLAEARQRFGQRSDFDQLQKAIQSEHDRLRAQSFEREIIAAEMLSRAGSHEAALRKLDAIKEAVSVVPASLGTRYESARKLAIDAIERLKREAEKRERERLEAEKREQERRAREAEEAKEQARKEAEARQRERQERERREAQERQRREAEERARMEAEAREAERRAREAAEAKERERQELARREAADKQRREAEEQQQQAARERARLEAEERERTRLKAEMLERERRLAQQREQQARIEEERLRRELEQQRDDNARPFEPGGDATLEMPRDRILLPKQPPRGDNKTPVPQRREHEPTVAELTPPEGVYVPNSTATWKNGLPALPVQTPPTGSIETPPEPIQLPEGLTGVDKKQLPTTMVVGAAAAVVAVVGAIWWLASPSPSVVQFITSPPGATLRVKDRTCVSPCRMELAKGDYTVDAQLQGYQPAQQPFAAIKSGNAGTVNIALQPVTPAAPPATPPPVTTASGTLIVHSNVEDARVIVDDNPVGNISGGLLKLPLGPKEYKVRVEKDGYNSTRPQRVRVKKATDSELAFNLTPVPTPVSPAKETTAQKAQTNTPPSQPTTSAPNKVQGNTATQGAAQQPSIQQPAQQTPPPAPPVPAAKPVDDGSQRWASISNSSKRSDFEDFRKKFPTSPLADQANKKIEQLDWESARDKKDENMIQAFLDRYPNSAFADAARKELLSLKSEHQQSTERQAIVGVLKRFEASYNGRDANELASVWPSLPKQELKRIRDSFKQASNVRMKLDYSEPTISGDQATVQCQRSVQFVFKEGAQPERTDQVKITLRKANGHWQMESVQ